MEKRAIFTIMLGENPSYSYVEKCFLDYSKKVQADLHICKSPKHSISYLKDHTPDSIVPCLEKFELSELLKKYDRVLYLDADILILPKARNLFALYPDTSLLYAFNEGKHINRKKTVLDTQSVFNFTGHWPKFQFRYQYFNAGVMLLSKQHQGLFRLLEPDTIKKLFQVPFFEQSYINYLIAKNKVSMGHLPMAFNRMDSLGGLFRRLRGDFIHYAGAGFTSKYNQRNELIIHDYWTFCARSLGDQSPKEKQRFYDVRKKLYAFYFPFPIPSLFYF